MAFKPGRKDPDDLNIDSLLSILNQTKLTKENNPLYQFCKSLLQTLAARDKVLVAHIKELEDDIKEIADNTGVDISKLTFLTWDDET